MGPNFSVSPVLKSRAPSGEYNRLTVERLLELSEYTVPEDVFREPSTESGVSHFMDMRFPILKS